MFPADIRLDEDLRLRLQKTSSRRLVQDEYAHLSLTSSEDVLVKRNIFVLAIRLQDVLQKLFKTSSRRLQDVLKTLSRHLQDVLPRCLKKIFSRRFQDVSSSLTVLVNTSSRSIQHVSDKFFSKDGYLQRDLPR